MMNVCNKGYSLGVCRRGWGQQAALNHQYLPTKLHCVCHGKIKSERTLYHIIITCGIGPSNVWRSSSCGMWHHDTKWIMPELLKVCSVLEMSRPTNRMTEHHIPDDSHFQEHSCERLRSHTSRLACMCWSSVVLIILPFLTSPKKSMILLEDTIGYPATSNTSVNAVIRWLERNIWKYTGGGVNSLKVGQGARPWYFSPWSWCSHQSCTCMFSSYFSVGFIDMVSLIKILVLCLFDKYLFQTYKSVTEYCWNPVFQLRPLTQLLNLLSGSASG